VDEELAQTKTQLDKLQKDSQAIINQKQAKVDDLGKSLEIAKKKMLEDQKEKRLVDEKLARTKTQLDELQEKKRLVDERLDDTSTELNNKCELYDKRTAEMEKEVKHFLFKENPE
jgi:chromosome segregation ATPase